MFSQVIAENLCDVKSKLEGLESAYHDMMMRVQRLQSNRVCLALLTGRDYPGEQHPHNCPCAQQRAKEEKVRARTTDMNNYVHTCRTTGCLVVGLALVDMKSSKMSNQVFVENLFKALTTILIDVMTL